MSSSCSVCSVCAGAVHGNRTICQYLRRPRFIKLVSAVNEVIILSSDDEDDKLLLSPGVDHPATQESVGCYDWQMHKDSPASSTSESYRDRFIENLLISTKELHDRLMDDDDL